LLKVAPGAKRGLRLEQTCWPIDIVPTIYYLTGFPLPKQAKGF